MTIRTEMATEAQNLIEEMGEAITFTQGGEDTAITALVTGKTRTWQDDSDGRGWKYTATVKVKKTDYAAITDSDTATIGSLTYRIAEEGIMDQVGYWRLEMEAFVADKRRREGAQRTR